MKSPFPGMDPYIEACGLWGDFHLHLIDEIQRALADVAPQRYLVRSGERSYVELIEEEHREAFIEILEADADQRLITGIEVLSPSNKRPGSPGWDLYLRKRQSVMLGGANLVEIDLLRGGRRMPMLDPWPDAPYALLVARAYREQACRVWPASFQQRILPIPVPLAQPDADLTLDLQPMIESIYHRSRYARSIDYRKPPKPALTSAELSWLRQQLKNRL